jgi:endonuclease/exonuclease/phosphatase family metal-dependent hydrolase
VKKSFLICVVGLAAFAASGQTRTLRIVTYNIEADIGVTNVQPAFTNVVKSSAVGPPLPGLIAPPTNSAAVQSGGVLEGIGEEIVGNDPARAIDILALEETTGNTQTVAPVVNGLNAFYNSPGMFTNSSYQATEEYGDPTVGDGPNAIVFNTKTVQLLASVPVDPPGGTNNLGSTYGEYREVMRYEYAPAGIAPASSNEFYIYVSHYKSGGSSDNSDRAGEAQIIRTNEAMDLPATARVLYVGDYNITASSDPSYQIIVSNAAPNGTRQGAGVDPFNPGNNPNINWHDSSAGTNLLAQETDNCDFIQYRDDLEMMTTNVYSGAAGGLKYVSGTYHTFGNNGSVKYQGTVNTNANTSLNKLATNGPAFISAAQLLVDLTGASDHLPVVADYTIPVPAPVITGFNVAGTNLVFNVADCATGGIYAVLTTTNLSVPPANWTALATNVANGGSFKLTATNAADPNVPNRFYLLQQQ